MDEETTAPEATEEKPKEEAKGLRAQVEALSKENRELKAEKRDDILTGIGLDPNVQLGKALVEKFEKGEVSLDNLATVATDEYGWVPPDPAPQSHPQAEQIAQGHEALDNLGSAAGSIAPPSEQDVLARAEAEGNYDAAIALKSQQLGEMLK